MVLHQSENINLSRVRVVSIEYLSSKYNLSSFVQLSVSDVRYALTYTEDVKCPTKVFIVAMCLFLFLSRTRLAVSLSSA